MSAPDDVIGAAGNRLDVDVAIVGYGPVGQVLAALLGRAGHRVAAFERYQEIYRLPRAVHLDHEIMRLLQTLGLADALADEMVPVHDYQWFGADGRSLLRFDTHSPARSGWESDYMFFQPDLEAALDRLGCAQPRATIERGWVAEALVQFDAGAELTVRRVSEQDAGGLALTDETRTLRAGWVVGADGANSFVRESAGISRRDLGFRERWVVGADGANSFVRESAGISRRDLGFRERWLVVDAEPVDMAALAHLPVACQWCDPARPTTHVQSGPRHRRWEFMLLPGEEPSEFDDPGRVWSLLEPWYRPQDGPLTRSAVYEFRSMLANEMRQDRVLLVGDAAHLTPPFLGQGLCSGLRDAANVAWKLDLVLRGMASEQLLDTIDAERQPQNEAVIGMAVELGKILCQLDPHAAVQRDAMLRQAPPPPPLELAPLTGGVIRRPTGDPADPVAGTLSVQGVVARGGREGRFDDIVGGGFQLIVARGDPLDELSAEHLALIDTLAMTVCSLDPDASCGVRDLDGRLSTWLSDQSVHGVVVRPDFYAFASARSRDELPALLADLRSQLRLNTPTSAGALR